MQFLVQVTIEEFKTIVRDILKEVITETSFNSNAKAEDDHGEFMNIKQASVFLNLAVNTIYEKTSKRILPHFKKGNKLMFKKAELMKWLEGGRVSTFDDLREDLTKSYKSKK